MVVFHVLCFVTLLVNIVSVGIVAATPAEPLPGPELQTPGGPHAGGVKAEIRVQGKGQENDSVPEVETDRAAHSNIVSVQEEMQQGPGGQDARDAHGHDPNKQTSATSVVTAQPLNAEHRPQGSQGPVHTGTRLQGPPSEAAAPPGAPSVAPPPPTAADAGTTDSSPSGGPTGANVNNSAGEGAVNAESTATAQPTSPSPESSDTETANGSGTANDGGGSTPAGSEPSNNPSDADNTDTTTTTTNIIPTEPANNKKGDADSSSSISSSVWVRVPLLIVATLACILVC
ncbi:uncharacterized protein TM35_000961060 [Trypanosoma theileri]|uniref:Mucin-associated surface protein (MASP) n=1 Tax=Trypanosoma theileri TaxID=67003 RepID=A0A1X0NEC1_9TRYP|nr:uncharacterized protein TM35_000961060 [Trypanosoma theileri]ORC82227.1 hypothetical protein TM35_000961060 [Trypanosoma theileri]